MFYRLNNAIHYARYNRRTRSIRRSAPIPCEPGASCELHTMLSARDVPMYLVAVKSFLRFYPAVSVVVHSDGTLDAGRSAAIRRHVPGCKIIEAGAADERASGELGEGSFLWSIRNFDVSYRRLIDTALWGESCKRIIMDADILVLRSPDEVIAWVERGDVPFLMGQPPNLRSDGVVPTARGPRHVQTIFKEKLGEIAAGCGQPARFLDGGTGGFYGCSGELTPERVESLVRVCLDLDVPMRTWGGEQCIVIYLLSVAGAPRLDPERYRNFGPDFLGRAGDATLLHFFGTHRFLGDAYSDLSAGVIADLTRPHHVAAN